MSVFIGKMHPNLSCLLVSGVSLLLTVA